MVDTKELIKISSLEKYKRILDYNHWGFVQNTIIYLKEYDVGLEGAEFLLFLTEHYKEQLTEKEYRRSLYHIWYFYLKLLTKADLWHEFIDTFNKIKSNPDIVHPHSSNHITTETPLISRYKIIERKIARQKQGKSVNHLRHKQRNELLDEEYTRRLRLLKYWIEHGRWLIE